MYQGAATPLLSNGHTFEGSRRARMPMRPMQRPRLKISAPMLRAGGELHIVGHEEVTSIPDPDGAVQRLVELADGSRSTSELHDELVTQYPRLGELHAASLR